MRLIHKNKGLFAQSKTSKQMNYDEIRHFWSKMCVLYTIPVENSESDTV